MITHSLVKKLSHLNHERNTHRSRFGLSFWRHPLTAEDLLVSKLCNLFRWRNKLISILDGLRRSIFLSKFSFFWDNCSFKHAFIICSVSYLTYKSFKWVTIAMLTWSNNLFSFSLSCSKNLSRPWALKIRSDSSEKRTASPSNATLSWVSGHLHLFFWHKHGGCCNPCKKAQRQRKSSPA